MTVREALRNKIIEAIVTAASEDIDGRELTSKLDLELDKRVGEGTSEKLQRGPVTNFFFQLVEGFWQEDLKALAARVEEWAKELRGEPIN